MSILEKLVFLCLAGLLLTACGAGTNDPGPKKPAWSSESPLKLPG
jgi:hypothetical protein